MRKLKEDESPMKHTFKLGWLFLIALFGVLPLLPAAAQTGSQSSQSSLADYARKVRKDTGTTAKPKVFDNDNLPKDDKLSVVGQAPVAEAKPGTTEDAAAKAAASAEGKAASDGKLTPQGKPNTEEEEKAKKQAEWKGWQDKLKVQRDQVNLASRELDVTQREYQLRAAAMYADVGNRLRNAAQWDKEETNYKQQIAEKQKALDEAKQKLEDMKDQAIKAGVPSSMTE